MGVAKNIYFTCLNSECKGRKTIRGRWWWNRRDAERELTTFTRDCSRNASSASWEASTTMLPRSSWPNFYSFNRRATRNLFTCTLTAQEDQSQPVWPSTTPCSTCCLLLPHGAWDRLAAWALFCSAPALTE